MSRRGGEEEPDELFPQGFGGGRLDSWANGVQLPSPWTEEEILFDRDEQTLPWLHNHTR